MATQVTLLRSTMLFGWQLAIVYFDRHFLPRSSRKMTAPRIRDTFAKRCIAHCKSVANPWRDHFFAVLRGKIAVRSRISHFTHK
jgi:hypothetical protein